MNVTDSMIGEYQKRMQDKMDNMTAEEYEQHQKDFRINEALEDNPELLDYIEKLEEQNNRYRDFIKTLTNPDVIARNVFKDNPDNKHVDGNAMAIWMIEQAQKMLEGEEDAT